LNQRVDCAGAFTCHLVPGDPAHASPHAIRLRGVDAGGRDRPTIPIGRYLKQRAAAFADWNAAHGRSTGSAVPKDVRERIRTDGRWLALDGKMLYQSNVPASEVHNSRLEHYLEASIGARFADRPGTDADKRAVREIVGIDPALNTRWSQREVMIRAELATLTTEFQALHGREPMPDEVRDLAQQATIETRANKHAARSLAEQRETWRGEAIAALGSPAAIHDMLVEALGHDSPRRGLVDAAWMDTIAQAGRHRSAGPTGGGPSQSPRVRSLFAKIPNGVSEQARRPVTATITTPASTRWTHSASRSRATCLASARGTSKMAG
jgi:hypothetical protein